ncbi:hypothetical protein [Variovorax sp. Root318D1]|uniref:hypothetical protein n=1 Tax=Variovorax sp. Root318D1 TaxID=1736513 RepID=UPI000AC0A0A8|nr:hypothetical protein [Variovorax sp. Root318D1]
MRIKKYLIATVAVLLTACGTDGHLISIPEAVAKSRWIGRPINEAMVKWGKPNGRVESIQNGAMFYEWVWAEGFTYNAYTGSNTQMVSGNTLLTTNYYQTRNGLDQCKLWISSDAKGVIMKFETTSQGAHGQGVKRCSEFYWGSNPP